MGTAMTFIASIDSLHVILDIQNSFFGFVGLSFWFNQSMKL